MSTSPATTGPVGLRTKPTGKRRSTNAPSPDLSHNIILYVEGVTKSFDGFKALNDLSIYIETGELRCIIGPNGAGKTTMMDVITGKTTPDTGSVWFGQTIDLLGLTEPEIAQAGIGRKFQKPTVFPEHSVFENLELAMACDWIIASDRAVFGQPEVNLGIPPGFGGTQRLSRLVGRARALELVTTARQVKADEALAIGLVTRVVAAAELRETGLVVARSIASKGPVAVRLAKQAVQRGQDLDLANACIYETSLFALAFATADQKEGMRAFVEKRAPRFRGE